MAEMTPITIFIALLAGIIPALLWLWFWLKEDRLHPEPRSLIILSFLVGMLATAIAYPIERMIASNAPTDNNLLLFTLWAIVEEGLKFIGIYLVALRSGYFDEPIDAVIYFVTIGLGFAALENAMFLLNPINTGDYTQAFLLGNFRFIGAMVLHVAASAIVGIALAFSFYERRVERELAGAVGLAGAIALHTLFNFSIIITNGEALYGIFLGLWACIILILYACERIKHVAPRSHVEFPSANVVAFRKHAI